MKRDDILLYASDMEADSCDRISQMHFTVIADPWTQPQPTQAR